MPRMNSATSSISEQARRSARHASRRAGQNARIPIPQATAACVAFAAFSVSVVVGISNDNPTTTVLSRALLAMAVGFAGGFAIGLVCDWLVREEIARSEAAFENRAAAESAALGAGLDEEVGLDGLTGVDIIEEPDAPVDAGAGQIESRSSALAR